MVKVLTEEERREEKEAVRMIKMFRRDVRKRAPTGIDKVRADNYEAYMKRMGF